MSRNPTNRKTRARQVAAATAVLAGWLPTAFAQEAAPASGALETVIVTATKRSEDLQVVPVAVSAITATELENRGISETSDLMGSLPNLQVTSAYGKTQPNFSLRGISVANEFSASTASPVGVYVDEVYQSFRASHGQQLFDLEQVEVLRGPQGTLFGRNTTGGAISFTTKKPSLGGTDAYVTAGVGNFSATDATLAAEFTPVADTFGVRVSGTIAKADGYTFNPVDGKDYAETDSKAARISLRFKPNDKLDTNLKVFWAENDPLQDLPYGIGYLPGGRAITGYSKDDINRPATIAQGASADSRAAGRNLREDEIEADTAGTYFTDSKGASLNLSYEVSDSVSITSITGYDESSYSLSPFDCDGSPFDNCAIRYNSESENFNQDVRVAYNSDQLKLIGGVYFGVDKIDTFNEPDFFGFSPADAVNVEQRFTLERPSTAIYGEAKYNLTDTQALTVGLRFTRDEVKYIDAQSLLFDTQGNLIGSLVPMAIPADPNNLGAITTEETTSELTGRLIYDIKLTDSVFGYASYSHGYRAGTYNALAYQDPSQIIFLEPETVDAFEIGIKSRFFDDRVQLNGAVFYYDYKNQQVAEIVGATSFLRSANGKVKGAEFEAIAQVMSRLRVDASLGLLDTRYDANQRFTDGGLDIGGNDFPNAPRVTANIGFDVKILENSVGTLGLRSDVQYMGRYFFDPFGDYAGGFNSMGQQLASETLRDGNPSYTLVNARLAFDAEKFSVGAWAKNLTDKFYYVYGLNLVAFSQDYFTRGAPRTYGVDATYRF